MGVDQARGDRAALGIDPGKARQGQALALEVPLHHRARPDRHDPVFPGGDDRGVTSLRATTWIGPQELRLVLAGAASQPAGKGRDLARTEDQEAQRPAVGQAPLDDPEGRRMLAAGRGSIVNIGSLASITALGRGQAQLEDLHRAEVAQPQPGRRGGATLLDRRRRVEPDVVGDGQEGGQRAEPDQL